jgi:hypothetical protein
MLLNNIWGLFFSPKETWKDIRDQQCNIFGCFAGHIMWLAAIPAIAGYIGTTQIGWQIGTREVHFLTAQSAGVIAVLSYFAMLVGVYGMGWMVHWMSRTYGAEPALAQCITFAAYTATPLFLIGLALLFPILWLDMLLGLPAVGYTVYLLYTGAPVMLGIPEERAFLLSSAVLGLGLVALVAILASTVLLWAAGFGPQLATVTSALSAG